jgi:LmbE family N-acetylglucosaminyl deacetylase
MKNLNRRRMLAQSSGLLAGMGLPLVESMAVQKPPGAKDRLKLVIVGGHPDDPQSGCGGTMALYANQSHKVVALFLTRGEMGIPGKSPRETSSIRTAEAERSCEILGVRPRFANQVDASTEVSKSRYEEFWEIVQDEKPDVLFTHWPIDTHRDHRVASLLAYDAWLRSGRGFALYYYEVELGSQTQSFQPNHYVDITPVEARKRTACFAHASSVQEWYPLHEQMHRFRGMELGCKSAEAFVRQVQPESKGEPLS